MTQDQSQDQQEQQDQEGSGPQAGDDPAAERAGIHDKPSEEEIQEIEEERSRRLDPENRPENAEVDNTDRTFEDGGFKD